jgi:hypothetical protein
VLLNASSGCQSNVLEKACFLLLLENLPLLSDHGLLRGQLAAQGRNVFGRLGCRCDGYR